MELLLSWGCVGDPISQQLKKNGIEISIPQQEYVDNLKKACNLLEFIVPESISTKNYEKANKEVIKIVKEFLKKKRS